ncbi:MAG: arginine deiminase-related protein, partial [Vicinamibacteria bacterium]
AMAPGAEIVSLELGREAYYHGDTVLASFGEGRRHLLAYVAGFTPESCERLTRTFGESLVPLSAEDASIYAANSFQVESAGDRLLLMPEGVSERLRNEVSERGVVPVTIDVSEFMKKGGGSIKCMIGDLGRIRRIDEDDNPATREFRERTMYRDLAGDAD